MLQEQGREPCTLFFGLLALTSRAMIKQLGVHVLYISCRA